MAHDVDSIRKLAEAVSWAEKHHPLPRCVHGNALQDHAGDLLEPSCGCRWGKQIRAVFLDFDARRDPKTKRYCAKCQKDIKPEQKGRIVRVVNWWVMHPEDMHNDVGEDCLVGLDCAKKIGMEFTRPE